jgi:hypothetical protein
MLHYLLLKKNIFVKYLLAIPLHHFGTIFLIFIDGLL